MKRLSLLLLLVGCFDVDNIPDGPPRGYETNIDDCSDGRDNDQDGFIDCQDTDCIQLNFCGEIVPFNPPEGIEDTFELCTDGIDNDENGQFDCGDRKCQAIQELCCITEFTNDRCSDGIDNDRNNFSDCEDFACRNGTFVDICSRELECADEIDNDSDGFEDCDDRDCAGNPACIVDGGTEDTTERCTDGVDNDGNGFTDCREFECCNRDGVCIDAIVQDFCDNRPTEDNTETCTDGVDNDGNGFTDCREFGCCRRDGTCINEDVQRFCNERPREDDFDLCTDGIDNDGNGFTDCNDNACSRSTDPALRFRCEADYDSCTDGVDNDGDGFRDCSDRSCQAVREARDEFGGRQVSPCLETIFTLDDVNPAMDLNTLRDLARRSCDDGRDSDSDGFTDCDDWDCQWNPLLNPRAEGLPIDNSDPSNPNPPNGGGFCEGYLFNVDLGQWIFEPARQNLAVDRLLCE